MESQEPLNTKFRNPIVERLASGQSIDLGNLEDTAGEYNA
jgi:hypothetical protein